MHLVALIIAILGWLAKEYAVFNHDFSSVLAIAIVLLSYIILEVSRNEKLSKNIFCAALFIPILYSSFQTGGVYSFDFIGLIIVPIVAIIILNNKWGMLWTCVLLIGVFYSFYLEYNASESSLLKLKEFDLSYVFTISIFFFLSTIALVMILKNQAQKKERELKKQKSKVDILSTELEKSKVEVSERYIKAQHDINQPLRKIHNFAELLKKNLSKKPEQSQEDLEFLDYILEGSRELQSTMDELSQVEA